MTSVAWSTVLPPGSPPDLGTGANPTAIPDVSEIWAIATCNGVTLPARRIPVRYAPGTGPSIAAQTFTVDTAISAIDAAASGANLTFAYAATGLPAGLSINASTGSITGTPTAAGSGTVTVTPEDQYGRTAEYVETFGFTASLRAQATGGADLDLSFVEDSAITATNLIANWTLNGNTLAFVSVSPALPAGLSINSAGTMSSTPTTPTADATYTLTMQDEYGRQTSDTFTLQITEAVVPVNPDITVATFATGTPATLTINVNYAGADTLRVILATRNGGSPLTAAQMQAGTGTFLETFLINPFTNATVNLDAAFTSASNAATAIDILAIEASNGGVSGVSSVAVSGLDFASTLTVTGGRTDGLLTNATTITGGRTDGLLLE